MPRRMWGSGTVTRTERLPSPDGALGAGREKSLRRADPRLSGAKGVKRVLGQSWALTVDFSVYGKAETLGANNTDVKRQHNPGESVKGGGEGM